MSLISCEMREFLIISNLQRKVPVLFSFCYAMVCRLRSSTVVVIFPPAMRDIGRLVGPWQHVVKVDGYKSGWINLWSFFGFFLARHLRKPLLCGNRFSVLPGNRRDLCRGNCGQYHADAIFFKLQMSMANGLEYNSPRFSFLFWDWRTIYVIVRFSIEFGCRWIAN